MTKTANPQVGLDQAIAYAERWIGIIHKSDVSEDLAKEIIEESKYNFAEHFNRGWLNYRKSITEVIACLARPAPVPG